MSGVNDRVAGGPSPLTRRIEEILKVDNRDRRTLHIGGVAAGELAEILSDQHRLYMGWLRSPRSSDAQKETATLRLIVLEGALTQLGVSLESLLNDEVAS